MPPRSSCCNPGIAAGVGAAFEHVAVDLVDNLPRVCRAWLLGQCDRGREGECKQQHHCAEHGIPSCCAISLQDLYRRSLSSTLSPAHEPLCLGAVVAEMSPCGDQVSSTSAGVAIICLAAEARAQPPEPRASIIARAHVWTPDQGRSHGSRARPSQFRSASARRHRPVRLRRPRSSTASRRSLRACLPTGEEVKVKFGENNGEVHGEVAATRLLWALGFGADVMYPVRVDLPWVSGLRERTPGRSPRTAGRSRRDRAKDAGASHSRNV